MASPVPKTESRLRFPDMQTILAATLVFASFHSGIELSQKLIDHGNINMEQQLMFNMGSR